MMDLPKKLNIGCGYDIRPGYLNIDSGDWHKPDLVVDITDLSDFPKNYFDEIVAQDVLEHIDREKQISAVAGWGKLLAPDGELKVRVPSLIDMLSLALKPDWQTSERQNYLIQMIYGTQAYPGDYHRCGYTPITVIHLASETGLAVVRAAIRDEWLYDLTFKRSDAQLSTEDTIHNAYFCSGRPADEEAILYWSRRLNEGLDVEHMRQTIAEAVKIERRLVN